MVTRKVFIIGVSLVIVFGLLFVLMSRFAKNTTPVDSTSQSEVPTSIPLFPSEVANEWTAYQWNTLSFLYPPDWKVDTSDFAKGKALIIHPNNTAPSDFSKSFSIQQVNAENKDYAQRTQQFYQKGNTVRISQAAVGGVQATKLSGTLDLPKLNPTYTSQLQESQYYLYTPNYSYIIKYSYTGETQNQELEDLFQKILSTIQFNK